MRFLLVWLSLTSLTAMASQEEAKDGGKSQVFVREFSVTDKEPDFLTIKTITREVMETQEDPLSLPPPTGSDFCNDEHRKQNPLPFNESGGPLEDLVDAEKVFDKIVNIGQKIWKLIAAGKPVFNDKQSSAHALPRNYTCWLDLEGWQPPISRTVKVIFTNAYGVNVIEYFYRLSFVYGGGLNKKGRFITNAVALPAKVEVLWGFNLESNAGVPAVYNVGTVADPVGAMQLDVNWKVSTVLQHMEQIDSYHLDGRGLIEPILK